MCPSTGTRCQGYADTNSPHLSPQAPQRVPNRPPLPAADAWGSLGRTRWGWGSVEDRGMGGRYLRPDLQGPSPHVRHEHGVVCAVSELQDRLVSADVLGSARDTAP